MKDSKRPPGDKPKAQGESMPNRILGSLRDALNAASRDATGEVVTIGERTEILPRHTAERDRAAPPGADHAAPPIARPVPEKVSAADAVREAKAPVREPYEPTTRAVRDLPRQAATSTPATEAPKTQALRGKTKVTRTMFHQDPVVGWLVVVGGPGLGAYRPIHEGNNSVGRSKSQRIPIDFGDDAISSEEQAYIRYDSSDRSFLFVPNLSKTNIVAVNDKKPTGAVRLQAMDVITMGRTQLAFVPFCGEEFDWSELSELKE
jgi:hypothetical protein